MYEVGKIYIWQHQVGEYAYLNGTETTVMDGPFVDMEFDDGSVHTAWLTDSPDPERLKGINTCDMFAFVGDLIPKKPPSGQEKIMDLFKQPELELTE